MSQTIDCPSISLSPSDPSFYHDPYPAYDRMRALGGLVFWADYGFPVAAGYERVSQLLRDRRFGREVSPPPDAAPLPDHVKPFYDFEKSSMLEREPPVHTRLRGLVNRAFVSRAIETLRPRIVALCHDLIDGFIDVGRVDLLSAYATPIPVIVIAEFLGLPASDAPLLLDWSHRMVAMYQFNRTRAVEDAAVAATLEFADYVHGHIARRGRALGDDLMSSLIAARDDGDRLSDDELVTTVILLMNAGHEATVHAIGNGLKQLLEIKAGGSEVWAEISDLLRRPDGAAAVAEEVLRFDPPLHLFTRYALEPVEIDGQRFAIGDKIGLLLGAANRDASAFAAPNRFDAMRYLGQRPAPQPMSFGAGIHFCVGAPLARLELQIALPVLLDRLPGLLLSDAPVYADRFHFHGLLQLQGVWRG